MEPLTAAIISGIAWELIKKSATITSNFLKNALKKWIMNDAEIEILANIINQIPQDYRRSQKFVEAYLDENATFNRIISGAQNSSFGITQIHSGSGDNVGHDKNVK